LGQEERKNWMGFPGKREKKVSPGILILKRNLMAWNKILFHQGRPGRSKAL